MDQVASSNERPPPRADPRQSRYHRVMSPSRRDFVKQMGAGAAIASGSMLLPRVLHARTPYPPGSAPLGSSAGLFPFRLKICVVGIGGAGTTMLDRLTDLQPAGRRIAVGTDGQALQWSNADERILIAPSRKRGLDGGGRPSYGWHTAHEHLDRLAEPLADSDFVLILAGMGGGTGTGAAPVIAELARRQGALTVALCTLPFRFEGRRRCWQAAVGVRRVAQQADTTIVMPNDAGLDPSDGMALKQVLRRIGDRMHRTALGLLVPLIRPGSINVGPADYRAIFGAAGSALAATDHHPVAAESPAAAVRRLLEQPRLSVAKLGSAKRVFVTIHAPAHAPPVSFEQLRAAGAVLDERLGDPMLLWTDLRDERRAEGWRISLTAIGYPDALGPTPEELGRPGCRRV
jgi:cell division protein FtsZ